MPHPPHVERLYADLLGLTAGLAANDPAPETTEGRTLIRLAEILEAYEKVEFKGLLDDPAVS